jgi:hypothetical protein
MGKDTVQYPDHWYFDKLGIAFDGWSEACYQSHDYSLQMTITPGSTPAAIAFKKEFDARTQELQGALDKARDAFHRCVPAIKKTITDHENIEHDNKKDVDAITDWVTGLVSDWSGAKVLVPSEPPGGFQTSDSGSYSTGSNNNSNNSNNSNNTT